MSTRKKRAGPPATPRRARAGRGLQRQRLIDACISALHIHGPSRTTVQKVVAIAKMSPGIVRFYFDSKAAMLVASLQFLSAEFEERVLVPVARLKDTPVAALELMVDLYLDPEIASARKVSVWYAFWGEASSRQEYYDICGQKDERFANLVRSLIERLIIETGQTHLDPDGVALGLIGVLEMLWQGFAFQTEVTIDRAAAKHRCMAYLRSVFPGQFALVRRDPGWGGAGGGVERRLPSWSYDNAGQYALELRELYRGSWQLVGHQAQIPQAGDFLGFDTPTDRVLVLRDPAGTVRAYRNCCPAEPHALVTTSAGRLAGAVTCRVHGLKFRLDGSGEGASHEVNLSALDLALAGGLLFVRSGAGAGAGLAAPTLGDWFGQGAEPVLEPLGAPREIAVAADWKLVVEQWLDLAFPEQSGDRGGSIWESCDGPWNEASGGIAWSGRVSDAARAWTLDRYRSLAGGHSAPDWKRWFLPPNQFVESRRDGLSFWQVCPVGPGRSRLLRFEYGCGRSGPEARALQYLARRLARHAGRRTAALMESLQRAFVDFRYETADQAVQSRARAAFHRWLRHRIPTLKSDQAPIGRP